MERLATVLTRGGTMLLFIAGWWAKDIPGFPPELICGTFLGLAIGLIMAGGFIFKAMREERTGS